MKSDIYERSLKETTIKFLKEGLRVYYICTNSYWQMAYSKEEKLSEEMTDGSTFGLRIKSVK